LHEATPSVCRPVRRSAGAVPALVRLEEGPALYSWGEAGPSALQARGRKSASYFAPANGVKPVALQISLRRNELERFSGLNVLRPNRNLASRAGMPTEIERPPGILDRYYATVGTGLARTIGIIVVLGLAGVLCMAFFKSSPTGPRTATSERKAPIDRQVPRVPTTPPPTK